MKMFEEPTITVIAFNVADIITTSGGQNWWEGGSSDND